MKRLKIKNLITINYLNNLNLTNKDLNLNEDNANIQVWNEIDYGNETDEEFIDYDD
jgi:hypothetical protein